MTTKSITITPADAPGLRPYHPTPWALDNAGNLIDAHGQIIPLKNAQDVIAAVNASAQAAYAQGRGDGQQIRSERALAERRQLIDGELLGLGGLWRGPVA